MYIPICLSIGLKIGRRVEESFQGEGVEGSGVVEGVGDSFWRVLG